MPKSAPFYSDKLIFLKFVESARGIEMDEEKLKAIKKWPTLTSVSKVRSFHGFISFYCKFVKYFSFIATPFNELINKDMKFTRIDK